MVVTNLLTFDSHVCLFGFGHAPLLTPPHTPHPSPLTAPRAPVLCPLSSQIGLGLLRQAGAVLQCYTDIHDAIWHAELGSSKAILDAGYSIDSLMLRYQGVDWRDTANWECNAGWVLC